MKIPWRKKLQANINSRLFSQSLYIWIIQWNKLVIRSNFYLIRSTTFHSWHFPFTVDTRDALYTPLRLIIIEPSFIHILSRIFELDATGLNNDRRFPFFFFVFFSRWWKRLMIFARSNLLFRWFDLRESRSSVISESLEFFFFGFSNRWFSKIIILASRIASISLVWNSPWKIF